MKENNGNKSVKTLLLNNKEVEIDIKSKTSSHSICLYDIKLIKKKNLFYYLLYRFITVYL